MHLAINAQDKHWNGTHFSEWEGLINVGFLYEKEGWEEGKKETWLQMVAASLSCCHLSALARVGVAGVNTLRLLGVN